MRTPETTASEAPSHAADPVLVRFAGGNMGEWTIDRTTSIVGDGLQAASHLSFAMGAEAPADTLWVLRGFTSNAWYTTRREMTSLMERQAPLGRPSARHGALIPIRKSRAWWAMTQDERRHVYEERSRHTSIGLEYLPRIARRLHHARDLGEPFDFLTWFEFAPEHAAAFDELLGRLRNSEEWRYVEREVEVRVRRDV